MIGASNFFEYLIILGNFKGFKVNYNVQIIIALIQKVGVMIYARQMEQDLPHI